MNSIDSSGLQILSNSIVERVVLAVSIVSEMKSTAKEFKTHYEYLFLTSLEVSWQLIPHG